MSRLKAFLLSVMAGAMLLTSVAGATVIPLDIEEMVAVAEDVVTVRVEETRAEPLNGMIVTRAKVRVIESFKGTLAGEQELVSLGGTYKQLTMAVPEVPQLAQGEEAILFLSNPGLKKLAKSGKSTTTASPLALSPQVVGGWQGKFTIRREEGSSKAKAVGGAPVPEDAKVTRISAAREGTVMGADAPSYAEMRAALQSLVTQQKEMVTQKQAPKVLQGFEGAFFVPERSDSAVLRKFDPLPDQAYMSEQELKELKVQFDKAVSESKAKGATK